MVLPMTTERAASAAHPFQVLERQPASEAPGIAPILPLVGCMTGAANAVSEQLARIDLPPKVSRFLRCLERATFGWAGVHRAHGHAQPGAWCPFELAEWVERTQMSRSQILHLRQRLVEDGLIWYEPDETVRGCGRIGWNLDFANWKPLQPGYRRWGGARPGAGRPRKQESAGGVVNLKIVHDDPLGRELPAASVPGGNSSLQQAVPGEHSSLRQAGNSILQQPVESQDFKMTTPLPAQPPPGATSDKRLRRELRKKKTETPSGVSEGAGPSLEALPGSAHRLGSVAVDAEDDQPVLSSDGNKRAMEQMASASAPPNREASWPPRQGWEKTDLDYYQRVLREREKERVALLTRLAHERIGVPLETASYARIGALAKQCGGALLVKHILLAAANHIDGDPLDYLTKLARGQQRKEANHATRSPERRSSYQPYSAEEARTLVWNTL